MTEAAEVALILFLFHKAIVCEFYLGECFVYEKEKLPAVIIEGISLFKKIYTWGGTFLSMIQLSRICLSEFTMTFVSLRSP